MKQKFQHKTYELSIYKPSSMHTTPVRSCQKGFTTCETASHTKVRASGVQIGDQII